MRSLLLVAIAIAVAACSSAGGGSHNLHVEQLAVPEPLDIIGSDLLAAGSGGSDLARVSPDGSTRWTSTALGLWLLAPGEPHAYVVTAHDAHYKQTIIDVDLATGQATHTSPPFDEHFDAWVRGGPSLYRVSDYDVARVDPATGAILWTAAGRFNQYQAKPSAAALWIQCGASLCGFAAADGHDLGKVPFGTWLQLTPDGGTIATGDGATLRTYDARTLRPGWQTTSPATGATVTKIVASDRWIVERVDVIPRSDPNVPDTTLRVHRRDTGAEVWSIHRANERSYLEYMAVGGDLFVFYDSRDAALHAVHLPDGASDVAYQLHSKYVLSTDANGTAPAVPDGPPTVSGDLVLVRDFGHGFVVRVGPK